MPRAVIPFVQRSAAILHNFVGRPLDSVWFALDHAGALLAQAPDASVVAVAVIPGASMRNVRERFVKVVVNDAQILGASRRRRSSTSFRSTSTNTSCRQPAAP
jgi:hypothetical protein